VTIDAHIGRVTSSLRLAVVSMGKIDLRMARADVVACRQGGLLLVTIGKEYFKTMGIASAARADDKALLV